MRPTSHASARRHDTSGPGRRARRAAGLAAALALALALLTGLAACGGDEQPAAAGGGTATAAPADALAFAEAVVRPQGDAEAGVRTAIRRILRVEEPGAELRRLFDEETDGGRRGVYTREIEPWLGDVVGGFLLDVAGDTPEGALLLSVRDRAQAEQALRRLRDRGDTRRGGTYRGVAYDVDDDDGMPVALVGDVVVAGTPAAFRAAVGAARGRSLADEQRFAEAAERVPADRLVWAFLDAPRLKAALERSAPADAQLGSALAALDADRLGVAIASLTARADEVVLEAEADGASLPGGQEEGAVEVGRLPGDAWLALAAPSIRDRLRQLAEEDGGFGAALRRARALSGLDLERDLLPWLGGLGLFVRGTAPLDLGAGIVLGSRDAAASERFVERLERVVAGAGIPTAPTTGAGSGFQLKLPQLPLPVVVLAQGDRVAVALGLAAARDAVDPPQPFGEEEPGRSAIASLGDGYEPALVLTFEPLVGLLTNLGVASDPGVASALPYLRAYRSLALGTRQDGDRAAVKLVATLQDPG